MMSRVLLTLMGQYSYTRIDASTGDRKCSQLISFFMLCLRYVYCLQKYFCIVAKNLAPSHICIFGRILSHAGIADATKVAGWTVRCSASKKVPSEGS